MSYAFPGSMLIDDSDPNILYQCADPSTESWTIGGIIGEEYNGTTHGTSNSGCSVTYTFVGQYIAVYGTVPGFHNDTADADSGALSQYFLDGDEQFGTFLGRPNEDTVFEQLFFHSNPNMTSSQHSLVITLAQDTIVDDTLGFWVDYLIIIPSPNTTSLSTTSPSTTSLSTTSISLSSSATSISLSTTSNPLFTTLISSSTSPSPSHLKAGHSSVKTGPVVGGAVSGAVFVMVLFGMVTLYFFYRKRRHRVRLSAGDDTNYDNSHPANSQQIILPAAPNNLNTVSPFPLYNQTISPPLSFSTAFPEAQPLIPGAAIDNQHLPPVSPPPPYRKTSR